VQRCRGAEAERWCRCVEVCRLFRGDAEVMQRCTVAQVQKCCRFVEVVQRWRGVQVVQR